jgi:uncharacterized repeat protein (TIGR03803 family)
LIEGSNGSTAANFMTSFFLRSFDPLFEEISGTIIPASAPPGRRRPHCKPISRRFKMHLKIRSTCLSTVFATAGLAGFTTATLPAQPASASSYQTLHSFQGAPNDGAVPNARLTWARGMFFGTTTYGGTGSCTTNEQPNGCGTVFSIDPTTGTATVIYNFQGGNDGASPFGHLIYLNGALYGTTESGGGGNCEVWGTGCGTIFELKKKGSSWTETVLYRFTGGADGANPYAGLLAGPGGALYGTTIFGGNDAQHCNEGAEGSGCGVAFSLTPSGNTWTESVLHTFTGGTDGANPLSDIIMDSSGTLYGLSPYGGSDGCNVGCGTVFTLSQSGGSWTESVIYTFQGGTDGASPETGPLLLGKNGVLYGTTEAGGGSGCDGGGCGTVFEMTPEGGNKWSEAVIYSFQGGDDSWYPLAGVVQGKRGVLYGTAYGYYAVSGGNRYGTVFELAPPGKNGGSWTNSVLRDFGSDPDGQFPQAGLVEKNGVLYGTTSLGGTSDPDVGTVFQLTP